MAGRLDAAHCDRALRYLDAIAPPPAIDLAALEYVSSAGLGVLLKTQKRAMAAGRGMKILNVNGHIYDIFRYAGFDKVFEIARAGAPPA